jgi:hypothetical protein
VTQQVCVPRANALALARPMRIRLMLMRLISRLSRYDGTLGLSWCLMGFAFLFVLVDGDLSVFGDRPGGRLHSRELGHRI